MEGKLFLRKYLIWVMILLGQLHGYNSCVEKERMALLEIKEFIISSNWEYESDYVLPTWTNDTKSNCCHWEDLKCNLTSGRVTEVAFGGQLYFEESYLLNLSLLHPFEEVRSLNLSRNGFSGFFDDVEGYKSLGRLRNLEILDLSYNPLNNSIFLFLNSATSLTTLFLRDTFVVNGSFPAKGLSALRKLKYLDLGLNGFSSLNGGPQDFKSLRNLEILDLSENAFNNSIFPIISAVKSLTTLFLRSNDMGGSLPAEELKTLTNLEVLDLSKNQFNGSIPIRGICEIKNMQELDLSNNKLVGEFPVCLTGLKELQVLDLSSNQLSGNVPPSLGNLESLKYLSLIDKNFEGFFSLSSLANLSELRLFKLSSRTKSLQVASGSSWMPTFQLSVIALPSCNLVKVPYFLLYQKDLSHVDLSDNKMAETFPSWLLENNTNLEVLFLQNNSLTSFQLPKSSHKLLVMDVSANEFNHLLPENIGWILPHLISLKLAHNNFQGNLPSSFGNMEKIRYMDMSHNSFHGKLPRNFLNGCLFLTLSHNKLSGEVFTESDNFPGIQGLSMDNNLFTGKIGEGLRRLTNLSLLDISKNKLTGVIPIWIGEVSNLNYLMISDNMLEGQIPASLLNKPFSWLLDLSGNMLSGDIPLQTNASVPSVLLLQDNHLSGIISDKLQDVQILDLRNNKLSGNIPNLSKFESLHTFLLRGNNFTGSIPNQVCGLRKIQLLDLADNMLTGSIPSCLNNTSFGLGKDVQSYDTDFSRMSQDGFTFSDFSPQKDFGVSDDGVYFKARIMLHPFKINYSSDIQIKVEFATKHRYDSYIGENLQLLFGMDLSKNKLSGEIPVELGALVELQALNLSHNKLSGVIPQSFLGLKNVESLDLSYNMLYGRIPSQLAALSSLEVFNVSFNNLSGTIPHGRQFNTFDSQSFIGNPFLFGLPTNTSCYKNSTSFQGPDNEVEDDEGYIDMISFYWSLAGAYVTILLGLLSSLSFDSPWSRFWFYKVDVFIHKAKILVLRR